MKLDREQETVLAAIKRIGREEGAKKKLILSAIETGLVESNLRNLDHGDADSKGWRQERQSIYKDPTNLEASIRRYFREAKAVSGKYGRAGDLAAAVQRPAAQYRGRYQERRADALKLLGDSGDLERAATSVKVAASKLGGTDARRTLAETMLNRKSSRGLLQAALGADGETDTTTPTAPTEEHRTPAPVRQEHHGGRVTVAAGAERAGVGLQKPILGFLRELSDVSGRTVNVTTGTNHNRMTLSGNVSDHWDGNAADLGVGGDARSSASAARKGDLIAAHAIARAGGLSFDKALAMARKGGIFNFQTKRGRVQIIWRTTTGGNHFNHVHVGVNPHR